MILVSATKDLLFFVLPQHSSEASSDSITKSIIDLMIFCVFVTPCIILSQRDEPGRPWRSKVGGSNTLLTYLFYSGHHPLFTFKKGI